MELNFDSCRKTMNELEYPPNHRFDPETFEPCDSTIFRIDAIKKCAPELISGGESLLDIGCNKGFISLYFREKYKKIVGIDINKKFIDFANELKKIHNISNIEFRCCRFEDMPIDEKFEVLHFGQCTHYLFRDAVRNGLYPLSFLDKAKKLSTKIIAIDGAFGLDDPSVKFDSKHDVWNDPIKSLCNIESYNRDLRPEFKLKSYNWSGDGATRYMAIFVSENQ